MGKRQVPKLGRNGRAIKKAFRGLKIATDMPAMADAIRSGHIDASRACDGKESYSQKQAHLAAHHLRRDTHDDRYQPYPCPFCGKWHVGRPPMRVNAID